MVADVREEIRAGRGAWTLENVYNKWIAPYPRRGELDHYVDGQDDEGTFDMGRAVPWDDRADISPDKSDEEGEAPGPAGVAAAGPPAREDGVEDLRAAALAAPLTGELERPERLLAKEKRRSEVTLSSSERSSALASTRIGRPAVATRRILALLPP